MSEERKKPGVLFWATVVVGVLLAYVLSIKPACWLARMEVVHIHSVAHAYYPVIVVLDKCPDWTRNIASWYLGSEPVRGDLLYVLSCRIAYENEHGWGTP